MKTLKLYGPPGTGKTKNMLELLEKELTRTRPDKIAFMTFTRAARLEALERSNRPEEELPWIKTIHAICYKLLGIKQNQMISIADLKSFGKKIGEEIRGTLHDPWSLESVTGKEDEPTRADRLLQLNHLGRHRGLHLKETLRYAPPDLDFKFAKWFTESYRAWKHTNHLFDYTDLLTVYVDVGPGLEADVVFIDEGQDLSRLQWRVAHKLGANAFRRYLSGDDDQAIFTWAGASAEDFNSEPAESVNVLEQSYRIPRFVHNLSEQLVKRIRNRHPKTFHPRPYDGQVHETGYLNYNLLSDSSTYILFRNHYRGLELAKQLEGLSWPYSGAYSPLDNPDIKSLLNAYRHILSATEVTPSEAKSIVLYANMQHLKGHAENTAASAQKNVPLYHLFNKDVKHVSFEELFPKVKFLNYLSKTLRGAGVEQMLNPSVQLMSIHQSKGREANTVILDTEMSRRTYEGFLQNPDDEHRVFYVAVTRARERLFILMPSDSTFYQI